MKKGLIFFIGMIAGVVLTIVLAYFINNNSTIINGENNTITWYQDPGVTLFDEPGEPMKVECFKVFQCLDNGTALAQSAFSKEWPLFGESVVLFPPTNNGAYYDGKIIDVPGNRIVRQIGVYRYETMQDKIIKQVPIIQFYDK